MQWHQVGWQVHVRFFLHNSCKCSHNQCGKVHSLNISVSRPLTITAPCCRGRQTGQAPTFQEQSYDVGGWHQGGRLQPKKWVLYIVYSGKSNKTISDGGITVNFLIIKVHTSNWSSNSWGSSKSWGSSNCWDGEHQIPLYHYKSILSFEMIIKFHQAHKTHKSILKTS